MFALLGCSKTFELKLAPQITAYSSEKSEEKIPPSQHDNAYVELEKWLAEHSSGWYPTSGQYEGGVYLKSGKHGIQITKTHIIIYSTSYAKPRAIYIQEVGKKELISIRNIGK